MIGIRSDVRRWAGKRTKTGRERKKRRVGVGGKVRGQVTDAPGSGTSTKNLVKLYMKSLHVKCLCEVMRSSLWDVSHEANTKFCSRGDTDLGNL